MWLEQKKCVVTAVYHCVLEIARMVYIVQATDAHVPVPHSW